MARYPVKPVPHGFFVTGVTLADGREAWIAGRVFYGDDEGHGEVIDLLPFRGNEHTGLERRVKTFRQRDEAIAVCEVMRDNQHTSAKDA